MGLYYSVSNALESGRVLCRTRFRSGRSVTGTKLESTSLSADAALRSGKEPCRSPQLSCTKLLMKITKLLYKLDLQLAVIYTEKLFYMLYLCQVALTYLELIYNNLVPALS